VAGLAESLRISAAVAALVVGIVLSGPAAEGAQALMSPLRDLFAALFFAFVGLSLDPGQIPPVLGPAAALAAVGVVTKLATGWLGAMRAGVGPQGRIRAGVTLVARGEFSIAIAGLATAAGIDPGFEAAGGDLRLPAGDRWPGPRQGRGPVCREAGSAPGAPSDSRPGSPRPREPMIEIRS
jgi:CPA2 family monovalent cation:H+ antiporter-2